MSGCQTIAESSPFRDEPFVGQGFADCGTVGVHLAVFHPCIGEQQAAAISFFIGIVDAAVAVGEQEGTMFQFLVTGENGIEYRDILVGRADNHAHGFVTKLIGTLIEPVGSLHRWSFIVE